MLNDDLYVDDLLGGAETVEKALQLSCEAKEILKAAGLPLRKWCSNSRELENRWSQTQEKQQENWDLMDTHSQNVKVLGLVWQTENDVFTFDAEVFSSLLQTKENTKRGVLKLSARIFDPFGYLSPYTIVIKCLFQELWERGIDWDSTLPEDLEIKWNKWCEQIPEIQELKIQRFYFRAADNEEITECELHCFCDSSEHAYGACVYLKFVTTSGKIETCFVTSKTRVAPLKKVTLPRLELMAALIGSRLTKNIRGIFERNGPILCYFWTDSLIVYHWIHGSTHKWKPFVANRVMEIKNLTDPVDWHHCPGKDNPADLLSRGMTAQELATSDVWWKGPVWLRKEKDNWPIQAQIKTNQIPENVNSELRSVFMNAAIRNDPEREPKILLNLHKYSSLTKVVRVIGWIKRFVENTKKGENKTIGSLTAEELEEAEKICIRTEQDIAFRDEMQALKNKQEIANESKIKSLSPFLDEDGILRIGGRLQMSDFTYFEKHPIILPKDSAFVKLLVMHYHQKIMHSGISHTLSIIREKFWIIRGRQTIKKYIHQCLICKKFGAKPVDTVTAPLPSDRVVESQAFYVSACDMAGPVFVKTDQGEKKAYICLFTCAQTRLVHLELVSSLNIPCFPLAFRRFVSRGGLFHILYSDNAKSFKKASRDLASLWKNLKTAELQEYFGNTKIQWKNIVECAPWFGGFYERMVRSVKNCIKRTIVKALLSFEELETTLIESEAIINSRPITYVYNEVGEPAPLTLAHFVIEKYATSHVRCRTARADPKNETPQRSFYTILESLAQRLSFATTFPASPERGSEYVIAGCE